MQLTCPSCRTAYLVDPAELGDGRHVRCSRCRTTWFARLEDAVPVNAMAATAEGGVESSPLEMSPLASDVLLPKVVPLNDTVMVEINPGPPLAPSGAPSEGVAAMQAPAERRPAVRADFARPRPRKKASPAQRRLVAAGAVVAAALFAAIGLRANVVRAAPDLAGLYATIGLPVNLRGLEFSTIKTTHEMHHGIPVLIVEGEIVNVLRQAVEVPRLRFAVLGDDARELYSWTALMPRSVLPEGERLPFRSRLASPPAEGKQVMVRFLNRLDLTANGR